MPTQPLRQLITVLRGCIRGGNHIRALRLLVTNLPHTNNHPLLRRYVAEVFQDIGREREATEIYEILVRHFTNSGRPLLAVAVAHQLSALEPDVGIHFDHLARVYGLGSPFLDLSKGLAPLPGVDDPTRLDLSGAEPDLPLEQLVEMAYEQAIRKDHFAAAPEQVGPIPLLSKLDVRTLRTLVELLKPRHYSDDAVLTSKDTPMTTPAWIAHGSVRVTLEDGSCTLLSPGALMGHRTILGGSASDLPLSAVASGSVEVLTLDAETLPMVQGDPTVQRTVASFDVACLIDRALDRSAVFSNIPREAREEVLSKMEARLIGDNTTIIHQGQESDGLFLVVDGRVDVNKRDGEWDVTFKTLDIGEVVGEISLVTEGPAVASVVTDGSTRVLFLEPTGVKALCEAYPGVLAELRESAAKRLLSQEA